MPMTHGRADEKAAMNPSEPAPRRLKIGFVLAKSFTLSPFALFIDTLRLASDESDRSGRVFADWEVLASTRNLVTSSCGVKVAPTSGFTAPDEFDYIVVVGGLLNTDVSVDPETVDFLKTAARRRVCLIGVCTGSFILAEAGLMKSHLTCVSWLHYETFRERFPDHEVRSDRIFNLDRKRGSCAGGSSAADMAATIVRKHISREAERNAMEVLLIDKARAAVAIQPRRPLSLESRDPRVQAVLIAMDRHTEGKVPIEDIARSVGLSRRQLERMFLAELKLSPALAYRRLRMERARRLLLETNAPIIEIALEVGYENASNFSRAFAKIFGSTPNKARGRR